MKVAKKAKRDTDVAETMRRLRKLCMQTIKLDERCESHGPRADDLPRVKPDYSRLVEKCREKAQSFLPSGFKITKQELTKDPYKAMKRLKAAKQKAMKRTPALK